MTLDDHKRSPFIVYLLFHATLGHLGLEANHPRHDWRWQILAVDFF